MSEEERVLDSLARLLEQVARPHRCDDVLPAEIRLSLWQEGIPCSELTPREELIPRLWERKRSLLASSPPTAA